MKSMQAPENMAEIDPRRVVEDPKYRARYARVLLDRSSDSIDHVELRRRAREVFPTLARRSTTRSLAQLVGSAATLRQKERDIIAPAEPADSSLISRPSHPLDFPDEYAQLDAETRTLLIRFCEAELAAGREGRDALQNLDRYYGWPFSDRTFYVGPWKAARLRRRRHDDD